MRDLLDGSSGVASFGEPTEDLARAVAAEPARGWTAADSLRIARGRPPRFETGARHVPTDTEDALLVAIIEAVTHQPFLDSFVARIQDPLALRTTYALGQDLPRTAGHQDLMRGYWDPAGQGVLIETMDLPAGVLAVLGPAHAMAGTVIDLARGNDAIHTGRLLSQTSRDLLDRPIEDGGVLGWAMCPCQGAAKNGIGVIGHTGAYTTLSVYVPSQRLTIVIVANRTVPDADIEGFLQELDDLVWPAIQ